MNDVVYRIVEHDGGWAYKLGDVFSETFPNRHAAEAAAKRVAEEQRTPGEDEAISWEDDAGAWHNEAARGTDRPNASVAFADVMASSAAAPKDPVWAERAIGEIGDHAFAAYDRGDHHARQGARLAGEQVRADPLATMLIATVCGFVLGMLVRNKA